MTDLLDAAFFIMAAFYSAPTLIGPLVFEAAATIELMKAAKRISDVLSMMQKVDSAVAAYDAETHTFGLLPDTAPPMPSGTGGR